MLRMLAKPLSLIRQWLDIAVASYHSGDHRHHPGYIYWNGPEGFDAARRELVPMNSGCGIFAADIDYDGRNDLVFANEVGRPVEVRNLLRRSFLPLLERADLPKIRFHDLRHTAATLLLGGGMHPKLVSEMLGHARISTTIDLYSHVTPTMHRKAAQAMDAILLQK